MKLNKIILISFLFLVGFFYQNCGDSFTTKDLASEISPSAPDPENPTQPEPVPPPVPPTLPPPTSGTISNYPLELVSPRAAGTAPIEGANPMPAGNRIFKAYPGLEYNIRAVVIGGAFPYSFSLSNAPAGMTIDPRSGLIIWTNPQTNATPTLTVTDSLGEQRTSTWAITVTTSGFKFIDSIRGANQPTGNGSLENPWRSISDMVNSPLAVAGDILYFRTGTYTALNLPRGGVGGPWERVEFSATNKPVVWLAYPGETPTIDFGFVPNSEPGVIFRFNGSNIYIDGFETRNSRVIGFQTTSGTGSDYRILRRLRMRDHNSIGANLDGTNASYIMMTTGFGTWTQYQTVQDCEFFNAPLDMGIKVYSQRKLLIENNTFHDMAIGVELKADMPQFTYRQNNHYNLSVGGVGGNMHNETTYGEILFNLVNNPAGRYAVDINQDAMAKRIDIYRNTIIGRAEVRNTEAEDGPFYFSNNVIVNTDSGTPAGSHIYYYGVVDGSRVILTNNLVGYPTDNIVDSTGNLTQAYIQYLGLRGHR